MGYNGAIVSFTARHWHGVTARSNFTWINLFANPQAVYDLFRCALPTDTSANGAGVLRNLSSWNLDMTVSKDVTFHERYGFMLIFQSTNVLNHLFLMVPNLALANPTTFGVITSSSTTPAYIPRQIEFGLRVHF